MADITRIYDRALAIRDVVVSAFSSAGVSLPEQRFVANGPVAFDCELFAVEVTRVYRGLPNQQDAQASKCGGPRSADISLWVVRCVPMLEENGNPPSGDEIQASALQILTDGELLFRAAIAAVEGCDSYVLGTLTPTQQQGGFGGVQLTMAVQL